MLPPQTLPALLHARAAEARSTARLSFLDENGRQYKSLTYAELLRDASAYALRLLAAGLTRDDIVLASFSNHESHVLLFWACCLAGIRVCPLPPLHPDPSRQVMLFNHLQALFHGPTLVAPEKTAETIRTRAPGLKILVSEQLPAGLEDSCGIFPTQRPSPDDTVCFMLTSGSTGNSKAVLLKHSNLLSSVRGKIKHHGTTSSSRFFNWIAFDHVACMSETHLQALEANASQWLVSPSAVIGNPRKLLEWLSTFQISYSFSPNFLLAQIIRDVSITPFMHPLDLSNLRALISGGESVPVSTGSALADIMEDFGAPRNALRAGFGMSETAAGCIYDTQDIPKDDTSGASKYLSLGKCCRGVEMRVIDQETGKACPSDVPGQFQVKGPTVFTQYYGDERATKESFTDDGWFITGDAAQLDRDGDLFLVGRDKDCVNINGVKYPTQDVEHYVEDAKIEGVTNGYVYVCPMRLAAADTETYGVFYKHQFIVEAGLNEKQICDVVAANRAITNACVVFCAQAPYIVLPLPRASFVKTSLGKVSRSQLSKVYLQGSFKTLETALEVHNESGYVKGATDLHTPVEQVVAVAVSSIFSIDPSAIRRSQNIFDIGASSMHLLRLKQLLQERLALSDLPTIEMLKRPEVGVLCDYLSNLVDLEQDGGTPQDVEYQPLLCFNNTGKKPPVFLVHPGLGEVLVFVALARVLADDRPVYALRARGFDRDDPTFKTFDEITEAYVTAMEAQYPSGPYYIAGYSFGAAIAFEIGKSLEARGKKVAWLGILNLPPHIKFRMKELSWVEVLLNLGMFLALIPSSALDNVRDELEREFPEVTAADTEPPKPQGPVNTMFEMSNKDRLEELDLEVGAFAHWVKVAYELNRMGRTFEPRGCVKGALTTVFCAIPLPSMGTKEEFKQDRLSVWREFSSERFEMIDVDGEHYTMLSEEHVESFAKHLRGALSRADECPPYTNKG